MEMDMAAETLICHILNMIMEKIQESSDSKCDISSSKPCRTE
jgi:hypothetical protein